jgi:hypothetical protein
LENLKTQKLKIKVPFRRVEFPSKCNVRKKHLLIHSSPDTILLNSLRKKGQTCKTAPIIFDKRMKKSYPEGIHMTPPPSIYRKVASSNTSRLETHAGFFRLLMKGIFDLYVL